MDNTLIAEQLLNEVQTISESYERVAESTGENFNIFSILKMESDEVNTHSSFIAELLNPKGKHGQKNLFLNMFIEKFKIIDFKTNNATVCIEYSIGRITEKSGGRIDILIKDENGNIIMIENKIYASEQPKQLERYRNRFPNGKLFYLTLEGKESEEDKSKVSRYQCLSYKSDIIEWLELCKKEAVNIPILRESITQYINLIKKLTGQNLNIKMSQDITERILRDENSFNAFKILLNSKDEVLKKVIEKDLLPLLEDVKNSKKLNLLVNKDALIHNTGKWMWFAFTNEKLEKLNINITFFFNVSSGYKGFIYGFSYNNIDIKSNFKIYNIREDFEYHFKKSTETDRWPCWRVYDNYENWENINTLYEIKFGDFKNDFKNKIEIMLEIAESAYLNLTSVLPNN